MKKMTFGLIALCILLISSCAKNQNPITTYGSWVFKSNTYGEATCRYSSGGILGATSPSNSGSSLTFFFKNSLPVQAGYFTLVSGAPSTATQVGINLTTGTASAAYDAVASSSQSVYVSIGTNGFLTINGNNIQMLNNYAPYDTAGLTFTVTQLQ